MKTKYFIDIQVYTGDRDRFRGSQSFDEWNCQTAGYATPILFI